MTDLTEGQLVAAASAVAENVPRKDAMLPAVMLLWKRGCLYALASICLSSAMRQ